MTNYRVRQVLALGPMPERQLRFLIALATWLPDDTRTVRVGFDVLVRDSGNVRNTVRLARRELEGNGRLSSLPGRGRGLLTLWTVLCLPEKGVNDVDPFSRSGKGVKQAQEKGSTSQEKRGQARTADQRRPEQGLIRMANPSGPRARDLLLPAVPDVTEEETTEVLRILAARGANSPVAVLGKEISDGNGHTLVTEARNSLYAGRQRLPSTTSAGCRSDDHEHCQRPDNCTCQCHKAAA